MLQEVLPIALYLLLGYLFKILHKDNSKELIDFVIYFSLPAIIFYKIYPITLDERILKLIFMFNCFILLNLLISFFIGKILKLNKITHATFMIVSTFGNTSFIGFSYINTFYGEDYLIYPLIYDLFGSFMLLVSIGVYIITWGTGKKNNLNSIFKSIFLFPPTIMFFLTIILQNFQIPEFLLLTSKTLGSTLVPIAMIAIGMKLQLKNIFKKIDIVLISILLKMIILPLIIFVGFQLFYNIEETWIKVTIIEVAMPPMTMAAVLAIKGGLDEKVAVNSLVIGVILSLLIIPNYVKFLS